MTGRLMPFDTSRDFTNYLPACSWENCLMLRYGCTDQTQYRAFLREHGDQVMADIRNPAICHSRLQG